jgi:hypothetical protein
LTRSRFLSTVTTIGAAPVAVSVTRVPTLGSVAEDEWNALVQPAGGFYCPGAARLRPQAKVVDLFRGAPAVREHNAAVAATWRSRLRRRPEALHISWSEWE